MNELVSYRIDPILKLQLDFYCLKMSLNHSEQVVSCFYDKVFNAFYKDERFHKEDSTHVIMYLITVAHNKLERDLLRGFVKYMHTFISNPLYK